MVRKSVWLERRVSAEEKVGSYHGNWLDWLINPRRIVCTCGLWECDKLSTGHTLKVGLQELWVCWRERSQESLTVGLRLDSVVATDWRAKTSTEAGRARPRRAVLVEWGSSTSC